MYQSLAKSGAISEMRSKGIKWIFICGIDNILLKIVDPLFLGVAIHSNLKIASKTIFKEDPLSPEYVFGKLNGKPSIIDHRLITEELVHATDESRQLPI